mmetsp:Transcript_60986/g.114997  ORF Transcript_60986/g.114997 Transcript_60986/m.114997 type:complete len:224 (-) Transcript_60986:41-712(-)
MSLFLLVPLLASVPQAVRQLPLMDAANAMEGRPPRYVAIHPMAMALVESRAAANRSQITHDAPANQGKTPADAASASQPATDASANQKFVCCNAPMEVNQDQSKWGSLAIPENKTIWDEDDEAWLESKLRSWHSVKPTQEAMRVADFGRYPNFQARVFFRMENKTCTAITKQAKTKSDCETLSQFALHTNCVGVFAEKCPVDCEHVGTGDQVQGYNSDGKECF